MNKQTKSVFSFNVDIELKKEFMEASFFCHTTMGPLLNKVMRMWLDEYNRINKPNKTTVPIIEPTTIGKSIVDTAYDDSANRPF